MRFWNGRLAVAGGVLLAVAGILAFGLWSSEGAFGLPTDVQAATVEIAVDKTDAAPGESLVLTITVTDAAGNPVAGASCGLGVVSQPGISADVSPDETTTDANGQLTATLDVGEDAGTVTVQVGCGTASAVLSINVGGAAAPPGSAPGALPQSGVGYQDSGSPWSVLLLALLGTLGLALLGTGGIVARNAWRVRD